MTLQKMGGDMGTVRREWGEFVKDGRVVVAQENAIAMILGVSAMTLHVMARENQSLSIKPGPKGDEWTIIKLRGGSDLETSLMLSYSALYMTTARLVSEGQRPEELGDFQSKLGEIWDFLGESMQATLRQSAQSPDQLGKNLGSV